MKQRLLILFFLLSLKAMSQGSYEVNLCPFFKGTPQRISLETILNSYKNSTPQGLKPLLENWARTQNLAVAILELKRRTDKKVYRWRFGLEYPKGVLVDMQLADLGTRTATRPEKKEVACFFSDTLFVMDTLFFHIGQNKTYRFFLEINDSEVELPYDMNTYDLYLNQGVSKFLTPGKYIPFRAKVVYNSKTESLGNGVLYLLLPEERRQLRQIIANIRTEQKLALEEAISQTLPFLFSIWGNKNCEFREPYDYSQAQSLEKLFLLSR